MDFIRPIGPVERDVEPVLRVKRTSPDADPEQREQPDQPARRKPPAPAQPDGPEQPPAPGDDPDGPSLIDVRV
jgi:hypothetical protein